ncbi:HD-GYP domain-containing protein [Geobacter sulfurreducens]|uniref:HD-GYP domain-containing protein n=1 Tax=Geobacter sulfurreducens TaxID=35554 RepID=UPI000DBADF46|nr:HD-GYP domain-containing protein [Geobacter sulfurreducens]BBA71665.1 Cyclic di-GMP phosphodiesterase response regulator RpfG [Geobacter sulfurreducens]
MPVSVAALQGHPRAPECLAVFPGPASGQVTDQLHQFAEALGNAVDARDPNTYNHSWEVAEVSRMLAEAIGLSRWQSEMVHLAGHLHDIGKIGAPDSILKKRGRLTSDEWRLMKRHPEVGATIIRPIEAFTSRGGVADMILFHHERMDGTGYPWGLKGDAIPLGARIIAVADTLSALLQDRPYRKGTLFESAMTEIQRCAGTQFDPTVVATLVSIDRRVAEFFRRARNGAKSWRKPLLSVPLL